MDTVPRGVRGLSVDSGSLACGSHDAALVGDAPLGQAAG